VSEAAEREVRPGVIPEEPSVAGAAVGRAAGRRRPAPLKGST